MLELDPGLWQGIGEVFTRHDDLTALIHGSAPRANNEALARVFHLAAEYDLPVMLHSNITSKRERNPLYLAELEEPLRNHPHTRFIWAHAGTSMEIHRHQTQMDFLLPVVTRLLKDYPNLSNWLREMYQWPGVAETVDFEHIKGHYYASHRTINPTGIVPKGPLQAFDAGHDRVKLTSKGVWS